MVKMTDGMRINGFARHFWLKMRTIMLNKRTILVVIWYNTYIFSQKTKKYSAK